MTPETKYGGRARPKRQNYRRRHYLVDRPRQLGATIRVTGSVLVLLLALNAVIAWQSFDVTHQIMEVDPELAGRLRVDHNRNLAILAGVSLIILATVVVRSIMFTHRTAGAARKIVQSLETIEMGSYNVELRLRSKDTLKVLEEPFNSMAARLQLIAQEDQQTMEKLATEIEEHGNPVDAEMLRRLAETRGKFAE